MVDKTLDHLLLLWSRWSSFESWHCIYRQVLQLTDSILLFIHFTAERLIIMCLYKLSYFIYINLVME